MDGSESPTPGGLAPRAPRAEMMQDDDAEGASVSEDWSNRRGLCPDRGSGVRDGLLRLREVLAPEGPIPVSRSAWWAGVATGRFPKPVKLGPRTTAWRSQDVRALLNGSFRREP